MAMKRCNNGHFYDSDKYQQCPYCGISNLDASKTMPLVQPADNAQVKPTFGQASVGTTVGMTSGNVADSSKTIGIMEIKKGIDPVVGWVVCVEGPSKGKDYRIKSERNFIGRNSKMDIALENDNSVARENHAVISFNPKNSTFRVIPGESHSLVYLNDEEVFSPVELKKGDVIELGETKLMFIPLCDGGFSW